MRLEILTDEAPVLRKKAARVRRITASIRKLVDDMAETMYAADGVGLAAPQVGVSKQVIVVDAGDGLQEIINPEILQEEGVECAFEGCLSVPGWIGEVERAASVRVTGLDSGGRQVWLDASGLLARALQHEIDHLKGILFSDKALSLMEADKRQEQFNIVYMGTPEFAVKPLSALIGAGHILQMVVTQPDRRGNRGKVTPSAVKRFALENNLVLEQPQDPNKAEFVEKVRALRPDFIVVAAYGRRLSPELLETARFGGINIHASLLPRYRGASPVQQALMAGDKITGISIMQMASGLDTGNIWLQAETEIHPEENAGALLSRLSDIGSDVLVDALTKIYDGSIEATPQSNADATYAPVLSSLDEIIDWSESAKTINDRIRALSPEPGARAQHSKGPIKFWLAETVCEGFPHKQPGDVVRTDAHGYLIVCGKGALKPLEVQPAGKRKMSWDDFLNGYKPDRLC